MKKRFTAIALALCTVLGTSAGFAKEYPQKFWDVPKDHWAFEFVAELADRNVLNGYEDGSFLPNKTVTRAEWATIMVKAANLPTGSKQAPYADMTDDHWANEYINAAKSYMTTYEKGNAFRPDIAILREDATVAMVKLKGYNTENVDYSYISDFKDQDSISASCKKYVAVAVERGLISGFEDNTFQGQGTLTRAEAATLLWKAFQSGNDDKVVDDGTYIPQTSTPSKEDDKVVDPTPTPTPTPTPKPTPSPTAEPEEVEKPVKTEEVASAKYEVPETYGKKANQLSYKDIIRATEIDGWIYYLKAEDGRTVLKRVNKEGTKEQTVVTDAIRISSSYGNVFIEDGWVYYCIFENTKSKIKRVRVNGTDKEVISPSEVETARYFLVDNGKLYFPTDEYYVEPHTVNSKTWFKGTLYQIHEMNLEGSEVYKAVVKGYEKAVYPIGVDEEYLYYEQDANIWATKLDGSDSYEIAEGENFSNCMVSDGWIYYSNIDDDCVYRVRTNDTDKECVVKLTSYGTETLEFEVVDNWIYFEGEEADGKRTIEHLYRVSTSGGEPEMVK